MYVSEREKLFGMILSLYLSHTHTHKEASKCSACIWRAASKQPTYLERERERERRRERDRGREKERKREREREASKQSGS